MSDPRVPSVPARSAPPPARFGDEGAGATALDRVLPEAGYRERLGREATDLLRLELLLRDGLEGDVTRKFCLRVAEEAERLEYGLLDVGARGNLAYAPFAELVTGVRWTAKALHALFHLRGRIRRYLGERSDLQAFRRDLDACIAWFADRLGTLLAAMRQEAEARLHLAVPSQPFDAASLRGEDVRWRLPQDVDAGASADERARISEMTTSFLRLADEMGRLPLPVEDAAGHEEFAHRVFGVAAAHEVRVRMHAVQASYDLGVANTPLESTDPQLKVFRGYVSILLHLLEAVAYSLQIHARFASDVRSPAMRESSEGLVPLFSPAEVLRWAVRFGLVNAVACFREARDTATSLLERYTRIREVTLDLPAGRKLHLRPTGLIVRVVQHHGLPVEIRMGEESADARQLMDVILLAAGHPESTQVQFRGDERVLEDLKTLFHHRLGEEGFEGWPASLAYLRQGAAGT